MSTATPCTHCRGIGAIAGVRCRTCDGLGTAAGWGEYILTWALDVDPIAVRGRRVVLSIRALVALAVALLGILGVGVASRTVPVDRALLGIGLLAVCIGVSLAVRVHARAAHTPLRAPAAPETPLVPLTDANRTDRSGRIDVAAHYTTDARTALERAATIAKQLHHPTVLPMHCFAGVLTTANGGTVFARLGVDFAGLKTRIQHALARVSAFAQPVALAAESVDLLFEAYVTAARAKRRTCDVTDILLALSARDADIREILDDLGITHQDIVNVAAWVELRQRLRARYRGYRSRGATRPTGGMNRAMTAIATPILDAFADDLTAAAARMALGPAIGRAREFTAIVRGFEVGRHGVLLVGPTGVGKTAIIEGFAEQLAADDVPTFLRDQRCIRLAIARITSGVAPAVAQERLLAALDEAVRSRNVILVVDPIEELVGASSGAGVDFASIIAGVVERGGLSCIGVTTPEAYRQYLERSPLAHTFERVDVAPPSTDDAIQIVEARAMLTEARTHVVFSYRAIEACVRLAERFLHDRMLPESAVAIMEETAAAVRGSKGERAIVRAEDVATVITEKTGVPTTSVTEDEAQKLLHLEERMHERMIGQEEAVKRIAAALRRARVELREGKRPIATFLFLGPTGVGKTELAKTVAATYFGDERTMVRLDMSEYQDTASIHRLIGAPPGSAGADTGGQLTEAIRHRPFALILLDELEKAHPDILNVFLQVFDDGRLTDSAGRTVDFTNTIIVATSNAGATFIQDAIRAEKGMEDIRRTLMERELREIFRPELLNRFDGVIVFTPLTREEVHAIARLMLASVARSLEEKGMHLRVTDAAVAELADAGFDPQFGARPLRRIIQERVQDALATFLLTNKLGRRDTVVLDVGGAMTIEKARVL
ncbi:AAA family ATPase [Candidatus Uhrbacteria bacterium]|nr:AAA family ATPase [Candidatus Uhrbacteria bacterium]